MTRVLDRAGLGALLARPEVRAALGALDGLGEETRLVGGCVRDALLGSGVADLDLATTLLPEAVMAQARIARIKAVPTGIAHGTVTLVTEGGPIEVTTLREDVETDGRHAVVRFGRDFDRDAQRRDFTVNALSLGADGCLYDPVGGIADLGAGQVRFIGEPATRIREDGLRILRFFRFHARFGREEPDPASLAACVAARDALDRLSRERVRAEFLKLLAAPGGTATVALLAGTGLLQRITGGVAELGRLRRAVAADLSPILRLAALSVGARHDSDRLRDRLRLSRAETAALDAYAAALTSLHGRAVVDADAARALGTVHGPRGVADALAIVAGEPHPHVTESARAALADLLERGAAPAFPLAGADLVARGVAPGPAVGRGLAAARALWLEGGCPTGEAVAGMLLERALAVARAG